MADQKLIKGRKMFRASKSEYEITLKCSTYNQTELIFNKREQGNQKLDLSQNITWLNPPFSRNITTNVAK